MSVNKMMKDGMPAKGNTQDFKARDAYACKRPMNTPMPMSNPVGLKMAMHNTFDGMPAYPNTYVFEGITREPMRPGEMREREGDDCP